MKEYKELTLKRYVIATLDNPTQYLISEHFGKYSFTENIKIASKTVSKSIAEGIVNDFYSQVNADIDLVVVPIKIEYTIIEED